MFSGASLGNEKGFKISSYFGKIFSFSNKGCQSFSEACTWMYNVGERCSVGLCDYRIIWFCCLRDKD